jgi:hypothetical protein
VLPSEAIVNYENKNYIFIDRETSSLKWKKLQPEHQKMDM